jgi:hypothetical protein
MTVRASFPLAHCAATKRSELNFRAKKGNEQKAKSPKVWGFQLDEQF